MKPRLYLETTIPSYLTARPTRDPLMAGQLLATKKWWSLRRNDFELFTSNVVWNEAARGDAMAAARRLQILAPIQRLNVMPEVDDLADSIFKQHFLPDKAADDVFHIATATVYEMHFLLTWNCTHICNREIISGIERVCADNGYRLPVICTPLELMGVSDI
jgi:hypothetical protein